MCASRPRTAGTGLQLERALDLLGVREGTTLLVEGAAGGGRSVVVQPAVARDALVVGTVSFTWDDAAEAHAHAATGRGRGKVVLRLEPPDAR